MDQATPVADRSTDAQSGSPPQVELNGCSLLQEGLRSGMFRSDSNGADAMRFLGGFQLSGESTAALSDNATNADRTRFLNNPANRMQPNVASMWNPNNRVAAIGDEHMTTDIKDHTIQNMCAYKNAGATAFAMEFLQRGFQPKLDEYADLRRNGDRSSPEFLAAQKAVQDHVRSAQQGPFDSAPAPNSESAKAMERQMKLVDAAIDAGLRPLAIEPDIGNAFASRRGYELMHQGMHSLNAGSKHAFRQFTDPKSSAAEREAARDVMDKDLGGRWKSAEKKAFFDSLEQARDSGFDFSGLSVPRPAEKHDMAWNNALHNHRNKTWAESVSAYLDQNPGGRVVMFAGTQHFQYGQRDYMKIPSVNERLKNDHGGIGTTVFQFAGGDFPHHSKQEMNNIREFHRDMTGQTGGPPESWQSAALIYTQAAAAAKVSDKTFAIRIDGAQRSGDYLIHLRQR